MIVTVVGEENVAAYAGSILEDLIDEVIVNHRINIDFTAPVDSPLGADGEKGTGEYVEEEEKKIPDDKSLDILVPGPSKVSSIETKAVEPYVDVQDEGIDLEYVDPPSSVRKETASIARKETSPIVKKLSSCPCGDNSDCWADDNPFQCKVFALSGFIPRGSHYTPELVEEERRKVAKGIKCLGGVIRWSDKWHEDITHVIAFSVADMERMTEKVMCALAAGSTWIVTPKYVKKSRKAGEWLSPLTYAWNTRAIQRRKEYAVQGPVKGQLFWMMKAVFLMKDEETEDFCGRLVSAGGGR